MYYIYKLVFKGTDKFYIGQTTDLNMRYERHWNSLQRGYHHNIHMQRWFDKRKPSFLGMVVLESFDDQDSCNIREVELINDTYDENFNLSKKAQGGDLISYHPNRDAIAKKHSENWFKQLEEGIRQPFKPKFGKDNPNYRHGKSSKEVIENATCPDCGIPVKTKVLGTRCRPCHSKYFSKTRQGEGNAFYGKHHSDETKAKIKSSREKLTKSGYIPPYAKMVVAEGKVFKSCRLCAKHYNCSDALISYRIKSHKWDFEYYDPEKHFHLEIT